MTFQPSHSKRLFRRIISSLIVLTFGLNSVVPVPALAQGIPLSGPSILTAGVSFQPVLLKGLSVDPLNPLKFDFFIDPARIDLAPEDFNREATKLIKYFLASLTVPEKDMWVNLSPYEKNRIIPEKFGVTEMGRDLLAQDYILKQLTASLMYPESETGKTFWDRVRAKVRKQYGKTDIPTDTFNKIWIVPEKAVVYEHAGSAFVVENRLKVMMEEDYLARSSASVVHREEPRATNFELQTILRELIIPEIEKEVNEGKHFASLRQMANAMVLATWYKKRLRDSLLGQVYVDQNKIKGIDLEDKQAKEKIYEQYVETFKKGVYNYIKEEYDPVTQEAIQRKYVSGGAHMDYTDKTVFISNPAMLTQPVSLKGIQRATVSLVDVGPKVKGEGLAQLTQSNPAMLSSRKKSAATLKAERRIEGLLKILDRQTEPLNAAQLLVVWKKESKEFKDDKLTNIKRAISTDSRLKDHAMRLKRGEKAAKTAKVVKARPIEDTDERPLSEMTVNEVLAKFEKDEASIIDTLTGRIAEDMTDEEIVGVVDEIPSSPAIIWVRGNTVLQVPALLEDERANVEASLPDVKRWRAYLGDAGRNRREFYMIMDVEKAFGKGDQVNAAMLSLEDLHDGLNSRLDNLVEDVMGGKYTNGRRIDSVASAMNLILKSKQFRGEFIRDMARVLQTDVQRVVSLADQGLGIEEILEIVGANPSSNPAMLSRDWYGTIPDLDVSFQTEETSDPQTAEVWLDQWFASGTERYFSRDQWKTAMGDEASWIQVKALDGEILGVARLHKAKIPLPAERLGTEIAETTLLDYLEVDEKYRRHRIGEVIVAKAAAQILGQSDGALIKSVLATHPAEDSEYAAAGQRAVDFFRGIGFEEIQIPELESLPEEEQEANLYLRLSQGRAENLVAIVQGLLLDQEDSFAGNAAMLGDWSTEEKSIESLQSILRTEDPQLMQMYDRWEALSEAEQEIFRQSIYELTSGHFRAWRIERSISSHFDYKTALIKALSKANLDRLGFGFEWDTEGKRKGSIRYIFEKEKPRLLEMYDRWESLSPAEQEYVRRQIYKIKRGDIVAWQLSTAMRYFEGSYKSMLAWFFSEAGLNHLGFELDWSSEEKGIQSVIFNLKKYKPALMEKYERWNDLSESEQIRLREEIYAIKEGNVRSWKLGRALNKQSAPYFGGSYIKMLVKVFEKAKVTEEEFRERRKTFRRKYSWLVEQEAINNVHDALRENRPDLMTQYEQWESLGEAEKEMFRDEVYTISAGEMLAFGLGPAMQRRGVPFFEGSFITLLQKAFPKADLERLGFELDWSTEEQGKRSVMFVIKKQRPQLVAMYENWENLTEAEREVFRREIYKSMGHLQSWGLGGALLKEKSAPYFEGSFKTTLIKTFEKAGLNRLGFSLEWETEEQAKESVRYVLHKERPQLMAMYERWDALDEAGRESVRNQIYNITAGHMQAWKLGVALITPSLGGSIGTALARTFEKAEIDPKAFDRRSLPPSNPAMLVQPPSGSQEMDLSQLQDELVKYIDAEFARGPALFAGKPDHVRKPWTPSFSVMRVYAPSSSGNFTAKQHDDLRRLFTVSGPAIHISLVNHDYFELLVGGKGGRIRPFEYDFSPQLRENFKLYLIDFFNKFYDDQSRYSFVMAPRNPDEARSDPGGINIHIIDKPVAPPSNPAMLGEATWESLQREGYSVKKRTLKKDDSAPLVILAEVRQNGVALRNSGIELHVFPEQKIIVVEEFYPDFPKPLSEEQKIGRGRALLRHLLTQKEYAGFAVISLAVSELQESFQKISEFSPIISPEEDDLLKYPDLSPELQSLNDQMQSPQKGLSPSQHRSLLSSLRSTTLFGRIPAVPANPAMLAIGLQQVARFRADVPELNWEKAFEVPWEELVRDPDLEWQPVTDNQANYFANQSAVRAEFLKLAHELVTTSDVDEVRLQNYLYQMHRTLLLGVNGDRPYRPPTSSYSEDLRKIAGNLSWGRYPRYRIMLEQAEKILKEDLDHSEMINAVARFYHAALGDSSQALLFLRGNNSLIMNMVNGLLRLKGYNGIPHGFIDTEIVEGEDLVAFHKIEDDFRRRIIDANPEIFGKVAQAANASMLSSELLAGPGDLWSDSRVTRLGQDLEMNGLANFELVQSPSLLEDKTIAQFAIYRHKETGLEIVRKDATGVMDAIRLLAERKRASIVPLFFTDEEGDYYELNLLPFGYQTLENYIGGKLDNMSDELRGQIIEAVSDGLRFDDEVWFQHGHLHERNVLLKVEQDEVRDVKLIDFKILHTIDLADFPEIQRVWRENGSFRGAEFHANGRMRFFDWFDFEDTVFFGNFTNHSFKASSLRGADFSQATFVEEPGARGPGIFLYSDTTQVSWPSNTRVWDAYNTTQALGRSSNAAMLTTPEGTQNLGGINLDPELLDLQIKRDDNGIPLPLPQQPLQQINIEGFLPVILNIVPATNLPLILGFPAPQEEPDTELGRAIQPKNRLKELVAR